MKQEGASFNKAMRALNGQEATNKDYAFFRTTSTLRKALEIKANHPHTESQLKLARQRAALEECPQKANLRADRIVQVAMATEVPLMFAHTEKFRIHASPVMVFMSFAQTITRTDIVDTESFVVNTKHESATAQ